MKSNPAALGYLENLPVAGVPQFWQNRRGDRIAWNEYGDPAGGVMMFYHGWPSSRLQARALHHLAGERGIRVIALDRPGMGQSTLVRGRRLEDWGALVEEFADTHSIGRFAQLGVSGGGPYVLPCLQRMPDRVVGSAVLCGAVPLGSREDRDGVHPVYRAMIAMRWMPSPFFSQAFKIGTWLACGNPNRPPLAWLFASLPAADREVLRNNPRGVPVFAASFSEGVRQGGCGVISDAEIYLNEWNLNWLSIRQPIRYWHGGQDRNIPVELVKTLVGQIPGARLQLDEAEGHFSLALHRAPDAMDHLAGCLASAG